MGAGNEERAPRSRGGSSGSWTENPPLPEPEPKAKREQEQGRDCDHTSEAAAVMKVLDICNDNGSSTEDNSRVEGCSGSSMEDDDSGSSMENDDGSSSVEDYNDSSIEDDDSGSSVEDNDGDSSVVAQLELELDQWELREWLQPPEPTEQENAVQALHIVRCQQFTECDPKLGFDVPTRFCDLFNIALFDFEKESFGRFWPPLHTLNQSDVKFLEIAANLISVKIIESDVGYPISVFGTILARDEVDFNCIYLFRRSRDSPQVITSPNGMLTLTGPYRGLAATYHMFFEINLKIKGEDGDRDFSKGVIEHTGHNSAHSKPVATRQLTSWMSTVQLVYTTVVQALEATIAVNVLHGPSAYFTGKITAWTSKRKGQIIVLYDSEAAGTVTVLRDGGSVPLSRHSVAVSSSKEQLVLAICSGDDRCEFALGQYDHEHVCELGPCELQVKVTWNSMRMPTGRGVLFERVGQVTLLRNGPASDAESPYKTVN